MANPRNSSFHLVLAILAVGASCQPAIAEGDDPKPKPVAVFVERCYDPLRLYGRPKLPVPGDDSAWVEADESVRKALDIKMPNTPVFLRPMEGEDFLLFQFRERVLVDANGPEAGETRQSCRIVSRGEETGEAVYDALVDLFDGLDAVRDCGYETADNWRQWVWSDNPGKDDSNWTMYEADTRRGAGSGQSVCMSATTDRYYTAMDLVHVRLLVQKSTPKLTVLELIRTYRPDDDAPKGEPTVSVQPLGNSDDEDGQRKDHKDQR